MGSGPAAAGVDGCRGGWIAVIEEPGRPLRVAVMRRFAALVDALPPTAAIAVDMPIGLPERVTQGGRGPERLVRARLGARQSSVFSIPARAAVYATGDAEAAADWAAAHRRASAVARQTSEPPRGVSIQAFGLFPRIRELDGLLRARPELGRRIVESHPEAAFWRLNGERAMALPKKVKNRVHPPGMAERRALLARLGLAGPLLERPPPGAGEDDLLDAAVLLAVARRHAAGRAVPMPDPPDRDAHGLPIAIWT
ncbi:DUF429 domain-containing protein [Aquibium sp. A9E412]|uniref:DUF429 domain-containing protein n=1 Tax=Aquibium sp. A9E412 TaxID=2976767 RepID=UPI0025B04B4C|nr:DUF429 domain-containing protein [Aquibium sp. A9E412]MDN2565659.1 DUF429 domain-containing protein [Aquibium sp. A9E412]